MELQLAVSVYHPLLFGALYKLMRAKCFNCHNLRLSKGKSRLAAVKVNNVFLESGGSKLGVDALP